MILWAGSSVVRTFASQVKGRGFKSHPVHTHFRPKSSRSTECYIVTKILSF